MTTVREELTELAGIEQKKGESHDKFARRLTEAVDKKLEADDTAWDNLSPESQSWFNDAVEQISKKESIGTFPGEDPPAEEEEEEEKKGKANGKANGKSKPAKAEGEKGEPKPKGRPRRQFPFPMDAKIKVLTDKNPKRAGSKAAERFERYKDGMTVQEALDAGLSEDIKWDLNHNHISIS